MKKLQTRSKMVLIIYPHTLNVNKEKKPAYMCAHICFLNISLISDYIKRPFIILFKHLEAWDELGRLFTSSL